MLNIFKFQEYLSNSRKLLDEENISVLSYCTARITVPENIVVRNGKRHSHNKLSYIYIGYPIQADHKIHMYSLFCLVILDEENSKKS